MPLVIRNVADASAPNAPVMRYVSPSGSDSNPGTRSRPYQTLTQARTAVQALTSGMSTDITVFLRDGVYPLTSTLTFAVADSGLNGFSVVWRAYPGERPRLSGGSLITGWVDQGGGIWRAPTTLSFRQLYVNDVRAVRARSPAGYHSLVTWNTGATTITLQSGTVQSWGNPTQVEVVIPGKGVNQCNLRLASVSGDTITPSSPERTRIFDQTYPPKEVRPYFFENALEFLTLPGEFYVDTVADFVYYMPRAGETMATATVYAPNVERLMSVIGSALGTPAHHLEFSGITFEHSTWLLPNTDGYIGDYAATIFLEVLPADEITSYPSGRMPAAVYVEIANNVTFRRCVFQHCGASALNLYKAVEDSLLLGNVFFDVSACGVAVDLNLEGNPSDARVLCSDIRVANNWFYQIGRDYYCSTAIITGYVINGLIEYNEVEDVMYTGIGIGWGWADVENDMANNIVRFNDVRQTNRLMSDGSGIYAMSRQDGGLIEQNYVHDIMRVSNIHGSFNISGLYLDNGAGQITVRDNVVLRTADAKLFQNANGADVTLSNNDGSSQTIIDGAGLQSGYQDILLLAPPGVPVARLGLTGLAPTVTAA